MKEYERKWLHQLDEVIHSNLNNPAFRLEHIAKELGISRAKLYRDIIKLTGVQPNAYIRKFRLEKAKEILETGVYPTVKETAAVVGFRGAAYFAKIFFEEYKVSPSKLLRGERKG